MHYSEAQDVRWVGKLVCALITDASGGCSMSTTAGGDLSGTLPSPTVAKVNGSTPGGSCGANTFATSLSSSAVPSCTQPSTANLSDYSTGTWTPALTTSGTVGTPTYTAQVGTYERVGRQVTARFTLFVSAWSGSPTGNVSITGLPVASANVTNDNGQCSFSLFSISATVSWMGGIVVPNTTQITPYQTAGAGASTPSQLTPANLGSTPNLYGMCSYHT